MGKDVVMVLADSILGNIALGLVLLIVLVLVFVVIGGLPFYAMFKAWPGVKAQNERLRKSDRYYNPYTHQWTFKKPQGTDEVRKVQGGGSMWRRWRQELVAEGLTAGERIFFFVWFGLAIILAPLGMVLLLVGSGTRSAGLACLVAGVVQMAFPIAPILRARVKRRERQVVQARGGQ